MSTPKPDETPPVPSHLAPMAADAYGWKDILQKKNTLALFDCALDEDLGPKGLLGDITSQATIPHAARIQAHVVSREAGTFCGASLAQTLWLRAVALTPDASSDLASQVCITPLLDEGASVAPCDAVIKLTGCAWAVLAFERVLLNFIMRLSGIATTTAHMCTLAQAAAAKTTCTVLDTRKTTPGWRDLEKIAVRCGGGHNHRMGLFDAVLIKDNHIAAAGSAKQALRNCRAQAPAGTWIQIEVDTLDQLAEILPLKPDAVLLDNFSYTDLRQATALCQDVCITEASGGIDAQSIGAVAQTGVDRISIGAITHSAMPLDFGLDYFA